MDTLHTDVAIVGGGPAGLMLAIELGCRGVRCLLLEEDADVAVPPKANASSARTMEHYRRRGFADAVRAVGLTEDHPQDVIYCTRLGGTQLARFAIPSRADAAARRSFGDLGEARWPTPELPHRGNQMFIEPILRREARRHASVTLRFGTRVTAVRDRGDAVELDAIAAAADRANGANGADQADGSPAGGSTPLRIVAAYAVGCEGARSIVREAMGVGYAGLSAEKREFFGGQMLGIHFRSPDLYAALGARAWTWWLFNPEQRGVLVAIDGVERFILGVQLKPGQGAQDVDVPALFKAVCAQPFGFEILDRSTWNAGHMLVAEKLQAGRLFIAGDAAHLFTPTGGMGYNTSVDDAVNLGWKLAAVAQGWAPPALLDSYDAERRPIAERNTAFARAMAQSIGGTPVPADIEAPGAQGDAVRATAGARLLAHAQAEFNIPGVQLGLRYGGPVIAAEDTPPPPDERNHYQPSGYPGARAPHVALADGAPSASSAFHAPNAAASDEPDAPDALDASDASGVPNAPNAPNAPVAPAASHAPNAPNASIFDRFGRDFTLLSFAPPDPAAWQAVAADLALPLTLLPWPDAATLDAARALYGADLVLIRPDHHIAWRGHADHTDVAAVLALATGRATAAAV